MEGELPWYLPTGEQQSQDINNVAPGVYRYLDRDGYRAWRMVDVDIPDYMILHLPGIFDLNNPRLADELRSATRIFVVLDPTVQAIYGEKIECYLRCHEIEHVVLHLERKAINEYNKSCEVWAKLGSDLMRHCASRSDELLAVGGGVVTDLVGFVASTYRRGKLSYCAVPTTLAGMVDAAISPKTAINLLPSWKNAYGLDYPPRSVFYDPAFLASCTTNPQVLHTGLAELVKIAIVRSQELFEIIESYGPHMINNRFQAKEAQEVIHAAIPLYLRMKWEEPYPGNKPASLRSFGHNFSRQLEGFCNLCRLHGDAVAVEMAISSFLSHGSSILKSRELNRILTLIQRLHMPIWCPECDPDIIWETVFANRSPPFFFPIPGETIGGGKFLNSFSKSLLSEAVEAVRSLDVQTRKCSEGRVTYFRQINGIVRHAIADFSEDGSSNFADQDPDESLWHSFIPLDDECEWVKFLLAYPLGEDPIYPVPSSEITGSIP